MKQKTTSFFLVLILFVSLLPAGITSAASLSPVGGRILYDTGFTGLTLTDETVYAQGAEVGLLDDLRGNVKNDGSFDVTFYGWCIGDITYQPGDRIAMTAEGLVATAVWVRGIFVDPLYTGGDSDGSVAKPYTDVDQAYLALIQAAAYSYGYEAISLYLLSDTEWVVDKYTLSTAYAADDTAILYGNTTYDPETGEPIYNYYNIRIRGAAVPVLFTAADDNIILQFTDPQSPKLVYYHTMSGEFVMDGISLRMDTKQVTRFLPIKNGTFGPRFSVYGVNTTAFNGSSGKYGIYVDMASQSMTHIKVRMYGGIFAFVYPGNGSAARSAEIILGTPYSRVYLNFIAPGNRNINSTDVMDLYHCKANRIIIGGIDTLGNMTYSNTQTYILRPNAEVSAIYDYYSTASANNATYCQNASRSLIFDGYSGSIAWYHLGLNNTDVANGVNRIELKNNATITFTHTNPRLKTGGVFHMESGSSLTAESLLPVGLVNTNGTETVYPYTEVLTGIDYTFNGSIWYGICGNTLGSSIRVKTPYGIRFGFEIDEADIENKTGLTVTRKGVLMIPQTILNGDLCHTTSSVLEIEATLPLSANNPNQFTACLVDSISNPGVGWLETWANVSFATRGYAVLSNGAVLYTDYVINSIQNIWDILEARSGISDSDDWSAFLDVPVQNQTGVTNLV